MTSIDIAEFRTLLAQERGRIVDTIAHLHEDGDGVVAGGRRGHRMLQRFAEDLHAVGIAEERGEFVDDFVRSAAFRPLSVEHGLKAALRTRIAHSL